MRRLGILLVTLSLALAACGDDDGDDVAARSTTTEAGDAAAEDGGEDDAEEFSGKGSGDFCDDARDVYERFDDDFQNAQTPEDVERLFVAADKAYESLTKKAPDEIEADVKVVNQAFGAFHDELKKVDYDFNKLTEAETQGLFDNPETEAADGRVESYLEKVCDIDADGDGDTDGQDESDSDTDSTDSSEFEEGEPPAEEEEPPADE